MKIAELYLVCMAEKCRRIVTWTRTSVTRKPDGTLEKHYELDGQCPFCGGGELLVMEVRSKDDGNVHTVQGVPAVGDEGPKVDQGNSASGNSGG